MAKVIKRNIDVALAIGVGLTLLVISVIGINGLIVVKQVEAQTTDTAAIAVSATVAQTIDISVSSSALNFGTLSSGSVSATNTNFIVATNATNGYTVTIYDVGDAVTGGLYDSTTTALIAAPSGSASSTLTAGTQGYGAQCSTTDADVNIYAVYNDWTGANNVGPLATTTNNFTSSTAATVGDQSALYLRAAISGTSTAATYYDTVTLTATGSF